MKGGFLHILLRVFFLFFGSGAITVGCMLLFWFMDHVSQIFWSSVSFSPVMDLLCVVVGVGSVYSGVSVLSRAFKSEEEWEYCCTVFIHS